MTPTIADDHCHKWLEEWDTGNLSLAVVQVLLVGFRNRGNSMTLKSYDFSPPGASRAS